MYSKDFSEESIKEIRFISSSSCEISLLKISCLINKMTWQYRLFRVPQNFTEFVAYLKACGVNEVQMRADVEAEPFARSDMPDTFINFYVNANVPGKRTNIIRDIMSHRDYTESNCHVSWLSHTFYSYSLRRDRGFYNRNSNATRRELEENGIHLNDQPRQLALNL